MHLLRRRKLVLQKRHQALVLVAVAAVTEEEIAVETVVLHVVTHVALSALVRSLNRRSSVSVA
jgi:hypothetical protein